MSDENHEAEAIDESDPGSEIPADGAAGGDPAAKAGPSPVVMMAAVAVILLAVLLIVLFRSAGTPEAGGDAATNPEVLKLRAEIEASRSEVNRQLIELGRPPRDGGSESVDEIAGRLKKDSEALIAITKRFQEMLMEQDSAEGTTRSELLRIEQSRQSLIEEVSRLRQELELEKRSANDQDLMLRQIEALRSERDALTSSLAEARSKLQGLRNAPDAAEMEALQRRFNETLSAKDFFEDRVTELERKLEALEPESE
jgi:chromosome segregation ATPase